MKAVLGLAAALSFAALGAVSTAAAAPGGKSAMETGSNATDSKGAGLSGGKMSGGTMQKKSMKKKR